MAIIKLSASDGSHNSLIFGDDISAIDQFPFDDLLRIILKNGYVITFGEDFDLVTVDDDGEEVEIEE